MPPNAPQRWSITVVVALLHIVLHFQLELVHRALVPGVVSDKWRQLQRRVAARRVGTSTILALEAHVANVHGGDDNEWRSANFMDMLRRVVEGLRINAIVSTGPWCLALSHAGRIGAMDVGEGNNQQLL